MNPDEYDEHHISTVPSESPLAETEPLTRHFQEMIHVSINPVSTITTR